MARKKLLFSFIVPVHGKIDRLEACVQSLLEQSYGNLEVILVLDGSHHRAQRLYKRKWEGQSNVVILRKDHAGAPAARNAGADLARGEILCFWDADCVMNPGVLLQWHNLFMHRDLADISFLYGGYRFDDGDGLGGHFPEGDFDPYLLTTANYISTMSPMRREAFPGWDESLKRFQDWDLFLTIVGRGGKGLPVPGIQFHTLSPSPDSISGGSIPYSEAAGIIRKKHGIGPRKIRVTSHGGPNWGIEAAKLLGADFENDGAKCEGFGHELVYSVGMYTSRTMIGRQFQAIQDEGAKRVVHWIGPDVFQLRNQKFKDVEALVSSLNQHVDIHLCNSAECQGFLKEMGIEAVNMPIPTPMPEKTMQNPPKGRGRFLFDGPGFDEYGDALAMAMPDVPVDRFTGTVALDNYKGVVFLSTISYRDPMVMSCLAHGRWPVTNMQEMGFGFVGTRERLGDPELKHRIVERVREIFYGTGVKGNQKGRDLFRRTFEPGRTEKYLKGLLDGKKEKKRAAA